MAKGKKGKKFKLRMPKQKKRGFKVPRDTSPV